MMKSLEKYSIGLDMGTNSVGYAVIDKDGNVLKFRKKNMMGVRLFETGNTAKKRRMDRNIRRRYSRRRERIKFLREIFNDEIMSIDENFFKRMDEGFLWLEDKSTGQKKTLFNDVHFTDGEYYSTYPTIYHLRKALCENDKKEDIRLIYLALHHIIKYRGNFLSEGQKFDSSSNDIIGEFMFLNEEINEKLDVDLKGTEDKFVIIQEELLKKGITKREKLENILYIWGKDKENEKCLKQICSLILGYKGDLALIFRKEELEKLGFSDSKYEENEDKIIAELGDNACILESIKKIYSWYTLQDILQGERKICDAMVNKYNKHRNDLRLLKNMFRDCSREGYEKVLKKYGVDKNYERYIQGEKQCTQKELYGTIEKYIEDITDDRFLDAKKYIIKEMEEGNFLPLINSKSNSAIPYQLNEAELKTILEKQGEFYPFLRENKEKIMAILRFKIPYYIGPLYPGEYKFAWVERDNNKKITPWNWSEVIDIDATAEKFIKKMTNKCTYIYDEDVLPRYSLLYSEYVLLNELNKIRINGKFIAFEDKHKFIQELFMKAKKVTNEKFVNYLKRINYSNKNEFEVTGYQKDMEFAAGLISYIDMQRIFGKIDESNYAMIEKIIYWITVFEDKDILKRKVRKIYKKEEISDEQLKQVMKLKYKGWGRLSEKLLTGIKVKNEKQEALSVMDCLRNSNSNLMQIIEAEKSGYKRKIEMLNGKEEYVFNEEKLQSLPGSPALRRGIWQAHLIVKELTDILGKEKLEHIYIEFARGEGKKERTSSRQSQLEKCYKKLKEEVDEYNTQIESELKNKKYADRLNYEKMYLYFMQNGKCMYTQEPLDINKLELYHVDHIIPQSLIKDDSLDNKVLVCADVNEFKSNDTSFLQNNIISKRKGWWKKLHKCNLISDKKYLNLQKSGIGKYETIGFINRQLVETRQISKRMAEIFNALYGVDTVVSINAGLSAGFRDKFKLAKVREVNDYHHAHDAYLAVYIGSKLLNMYGGAFENEFVYSAYQKYQRKIVQERAKSKYGYFMHYFNEEDAKRVIKVFNYKGLPVTKKLEELDGEFYKITINAKDSKDAVIPIKKGMDVKKYGGYTGNNNAYSLIVEYKKKNKMLKELVGIPVRIAYLAKVDGDAIENYLREELKTSELQVVRPNLKIKKNQLIEVDGYRRYLVSAQEAVNAVQMCFEKEVNQKYLYELAKIEDSDSQLDEEIINNLYVDIHRKLEAKYEEFSSVVNKIYNSIKWDELSLEKKAKVIMEILKLVQCNSQYPNLKMVGLVDRMGRKAYNVKLEKTSFIFQSVTGLFECKWNVNDEMHRKEKS